jgi:gamma-butyrobetaine hydroxylase
MRVEARSRGVEVEWDDGSRSRFAAIWLRDNCRCPDCLHPGTQERLLDTADLAADVAPASAQLVNGAVEVVWADDGHTSRYATEWLRAPRRLPRRQTLWRAEMGERLPERRYDDLAAKGEGLRDWLAAVHEYGFAILRGGPVEDGTVARVAELFGYVRETNYGRVFDVRSVVNPNNLAYTGLALGPHTDNAYRDPPPTLQLLHCLASSASGGDSTLVDGFAVADALRNEKPAAFALLTQHQVVFAFRDAETELETEAPVIELDLRGKIAAVRYSTRAAAPFDFSEDVLERYYDAYQTFGRMLVGPAFQISFRLEPGDLFIVDNRRVLHGRTGFSGEGTRHLQGCYADTDGLRSTLAVLSR